MRVVRHTLNRLPRLKRSLQSVYYFLHGTPQVSHSEITAKDLRASAGRPDPLILEIGANDGGHTKWFLETFENPTIYCFEPDPRASARWRRNIGTRTNVRLFELAMSDRDGEITFYQSGGERDGAHTETMPDGWDLSGSIRKPKDHLLIEPGVTFESTIRVATTSLDRWADEHSIGAIDLLWMDVQGAERDVLSGGRRALARTRFLYTEYSEREMYEGQYTFKQLVKALPGFEVVTRYPADVRRRNTRLTSMA
jgi:FkbM family methyltransferase